MNDYQEKIVEWVHCNKCLRQTRHEIIAVRVLDEADDIDGKFTIDWKTTNTMLECCGCGSITLRRRVQSHMLDEDYAEFYPPPISRQIPRWHIDLPDEMSSLIRETYKALHADSRRLALMGARALVDLFMNSTVGDIGGFEAKLDNLVKQGYLSEKNKAMLEPALDAGHAATHRAYNPKAEDVNLVFDIVENLLQTKIFEGKVENLKKHTPKRRPKKR